MFFKNNWRWFIAIINLKFNIINIKLNLIINIKLIIVIIYELIIITIKWKKFKNIVKEKIIKH